MNKTSVTIAIAAFASGLAIGVAVVFGTDETTPPQQPKKHSLNPALVVYNADAPPPQQKFMKRVEDEK